MSIHSNQEDDNGDDDTYSVAAFSVATAKVNNVSADAVVLRGVKDLYAVLCNSLSGYDDGVSKGFSAIFGMYLVDPDSEVRREFWDAYLAILGKDFVNKPDVSTALQNFVDSINNLTSDRLKEIFPPARPLGVHPPQEDASNFDSDTTTRVPTKNNCCERLWDVMSFKNRSSRPALSPTPANFRPSPAAMEFIANGGSDVSALHENSAGGGSNAASSAAANSNGTGPPNLDDGTVVEIDTNNNNGGSEVGPPFADPIGSDAASSAADNGAELPSLVDDADVEEFDADHNGGSVVSLVTNSSEFNAPAPAGGNSGTTKHTSWEDDKVSL